ncbi:hypothetical protein BOTBODRAFT_451501 [Botryobasidium botryosum FD-172 SS1]|uniref:SET domain-containing protein n=1 Tax=Botryobasidium botryosum (strain FD-172 SS1) TaxID=930990 RepID=A0A067MHZ9_BOTB1|nr:hypothetical protein BOTBODRAFT_451501 [Botryobasidium botryosum FD-172 SS1]
MKRGFLLAKKGKGRQSRRGAHTSSTFPGSAPPLSKRHELTSSPIVPAAESSQAADPAETLFIKIPTVEGGMWSGPLSAYIDIMGLNPSVVDWAFLESAAVIESGCRVVDWAAFRKSVSTSDSAALPPNPPPMSTSSAHKLHDEYIGTWLPFAYEVRGQYTSEQLKEGEALCMLPRGIKEQILVLPSFPHRLAIAPSKCKFRIGTSALSGLGMFATADFATGDIILDERPLLVTPQIIHFDFLKQAVDTMPKWFRAAYLALANVKGNTCAPEVGIIRTNAFGVDLPGSDDVFTAVFEHTSRCNHSCVPNAIRGIQSRQRLLLPRGSNSRLSEAPY